ncbi:MAG: hypothetical protein K0U84_15140 [Actinomycetia bacterium]|nr:hypothetical protein [Actinomycetes bacterium]
MAFETIRLSPSGAPITNDQGVPLTPGPGMVLRQDDDAIAVSNPDLTSGEETVIQTDLDEPSGTPLLVQLDNPNPNLRYRLEGSTAIVNTNTDATVVTVTFKIQVSVDGGTVFTDVASNQSVQDVREDSTTRVWYGNELELGSFYGITATTTNVQFRVVVTAAGANSEINALGSSGNAWLLLQECA